LRAGFALLAGGVALALVQMACAQGSNMRLPKTVQAGSAFSIESTGSGDVTLYLVGPGQAVKRAVKLGETISFAPGTLNNAGVYLVILTGDSTTEHGTLNVTPAEAAAHLTFLARPSRLAVSLNNGISGAVYVFDAYHNLITKPMDVTFELSPTSGASQQRKTKTVDGAGWTQMNSTAKEGMDKFVAQVNGVTSKRIVEQVPGEPCELRMTAQPAGNQLQLKTAPVRDCSGNAVPDGTIVTFTENYGGTQSTVDVPLKRGIAEVKMPAHAGARITVASGVVLGNEIQWER